MLFIVATNILASRPPARWPTGMPHARANGQYNRITKQDSATSHVTKWPTITISIVYNLVFNTFNGREKQQLCVVEFYVEC